MVKKVFKKILSMSCVAALLMTAPGTTLLADDILEGISVSETSEMIQLKFQRLTQMNQMKQR